MTAYTLAEMVDLDLGEDITGPAFNLSHVLPCGTCGEVSETVEVIPGWDDDTVRRLCAGCYPVIVWGVES